MRGEFIDAKHAIVGEHEVDHDYVPENQHPPAAADAAAAGSVNAAGASIN